MSSDRCTPHGQKAGWEVYVGLELTEAEHSEQELEWASGGIMSVWLVAEEAKTEEILPWMCFQAATR